MLRHHLGGLLSVEKAYISRRSSRRARTNFFQENSFFCHYCWALGRVSPVTVDRWGRPRLTPNKHYINGYLSAPSAGVVGGWKVPVRYCYVASCGIAGRGVFRLCVYAGVCGCVVWQDIYVPGIISFSFLLNVYVRSLYVLRKPYKYAGASK